MYTPNAYATDLRITLATNNDDLRSYKITLTKRYLTSIKKATNCPLSLPHVTKKEKLTIKII